MTNFVYWTMTVSSEICMIANENKVLGGIDSNSTREIKKELVS
jgi:hypothetical protein